MEYIKSSNIDIDNGFFHFTRIDNRQSIQDNGLQAVAGGENPEGNDKENPTIYFAKGILGVFKAVDAWARWEYEGYVKQADHRINHGYEGYDKDVMQKITFNKLYNDFKDRQYYIIDLIEGPNGDFEYGDIDKKKVLARNKNGIPGLNPVWEMGPYTDWGTPDNPNNLQEDWNMNTKIGERVICSDRLKIVETETGRTDALSFILESYDKYRNLLPEQYSEMFEIFDNFIAYAKERYKNDRDFVDGMPDVGRREINLERQEELQRINQITPSSIAQTAEQYAQENPGQISEGVKRVSNIFSRVKENTDRTL